MDLSYPPGFSMNDSIDPGSCSLVYTTVEKVAQRVMHLGRGALMAKVDNESAYQLILVHLPDHPLLGSFNVRPLTCPVTLKVSLPPLLRA